MPPPASGLRPEDATSYAEFLERLGKERSRTLMGQFSLATRLRWVLGVISTPIGFILLLGALVESRSALWWEWAVGGGCVAIVVWLAATGIRQSLRAHRRRRELDELVRVWRERAGKGQVPLSTASGLVEQWKEASDMRLQLRVAHDLDRAEAAQPPSSGPSSDALMYASVASVGIGLLCLLVLFVAAALHAPILVLWALLVAMPLCGLVGLAVYVVSGRRQRAEFARTMAVLDRVRSAGHGAPDVQPPGRRGGG